MIRSWLNTVTRSLIIGLCCFSLMSASAYDETPNSEGIQVYQKNVHLSAEHKQRLANDIDRYHNAADLWNVLRQEFTLPHYDDTPEVRRQIASYINQPDELIETTHRAVPYLYYILQQARKRHLPIELVLLPMIESDYNPFAYSSAGAAGIWQMMPGTASGYGIKRNSWYDGRRDVIASTNAALDHLVYLDNFFAGNWLLAIAAYDCGEGTVLAAIKRNIREGKNTDFWSLPLPQETRNYVPRLLALAVIISHPDVFPIPLPTVGNAPYLAQVDVGSPVNLKQSAELAGMSLKTMMQLNPAYNRATAGQHGPSKLVLPIEQVELFAENLARLPSHQYIDWIHYRVKSGDTVVKIAKRFNTTPDVVEKTNPTLANNIKPGVNIVIPRTQDDVVDNNTAIPDNTAPVQVAEQTTTTVEKTDAAPKAQETMVLAQQKNNAEPAQPYAMQSGDTLYMVRPGDEIEKIAKHFHASLQKVLAINKIHSNSVLHEGDKLIIPTHEIASSTQYKLAPGDTVYMVRKGDSIEKIAVKFHTTPAAIRVANLIASNDIQEGDRLMIPTHLS